jgi:microcystin-dependent protein
MNLRSFDYATIVAMVIAIVSGIFYLGGLNTAVKALDPSQIQQQINEGVLQIKRESKQIINQVPVGSVIAFAGPKANLPKGWMLCNGDKIEDTKAEYEELRRAIGYTYGGSVQDKYLKLPDYNGLFLRGIDLTGKVDEEGMRVLGHIQSDSTRLPNKEFSTNKDGKHQHNYNSNRMSADRGGKDGYWYSSQTPTSPRTIGDASHVHAITEGGDKETRPVNKAIFWIIKVTSDGNSL